MPVILRTNSGEWLQLLPDAVTALTARLQGDVLLPDSPGYDEARAVWNATIDRHPGMIVRCTDSSDVQNAIRFAAENALLVSVRGGGHNIAGSAVCNGGIVIDLSAMRDVRIDVPARTAHVAPGCTLADFDSAAQAHGLATPLGINSTTGVAGLTLGGGFGWISRSFGLTADNLRSADVVTAAGERVRVSEESEPDLFWALRGGSGNFGVVTSFEFALHAVGPDVLCGLIVHPFEDAPELLRFYREFAATLPDELAVWVVLRQAPPLPFLPAEWHGREILVFAVCYAGSDTARGEALLAPLRAHGAPIADVIAVQPYTDWQQAFDPLLTPGARNYWKSHDFSELADGALDAVVAYTARLPTPECEIFIGQVGGAMGRVDAHATAYPHRDTRYILNVHTRWREAALDNECIGWARSFFAATAPYATGGVYVNFMTEDEQERVRAAYGPNYDRLVRVKQMYDPSNLFRSNQNIRPQPIGSPLER